ncbi:MAG: hypothetical protein A2579_08250 [Lysobacterales bacterium RIFOXYD1_FULL_69_11]|nr:MAG: hypothetical protein A2190_05990 [Xanthomonadales bacterium RIFOXYA1_FULL_69_10]OHE87307.1 MAG: hypothetical protein A2579_08250 [Xanthomonadales bacterium RIFOXYD1_FULL_69_11]
MLAIVSGIIVLLMLQLLRVGGKRRLGATIGLFCLGAALGVALVGYVLAPPRFLPNASTSGLAFRAAQSIRSGLANPDNDGFLILDGGSYAARGLDERMLERHLAVEGHHAMTVVSLSLPGGNQLERWSVLNRALAILEPAERDAFGKARKVLLLEIHPQYDRYPLVQLRRNRYSDRAFAYLDTDVLAAAVRAENGALKPDLLRQQWIDAVSHAAINLFNVGELHRVIPAHEVASSGGFTPLTRASKGYRFKGTRGAVKSLDEPPVASDELPWPNIQQRRQRFENALGGAGIQTVYFSVPTPRVHDMAYARGFCAAVEDACIVHAHRGLLRRLDHRRFWYDDGHLMKPGARIYTRWLAQRLKGALNDSGSTQP